MHILKNLDFVYILGTGSRWKDNELRYSLRSLAEFVPHRRVIVIGHRPTWLKNVLHIPAADDQDNKLKNAIQKIRIACQTPGITPDFVLMNDDFFFLRPHQEIQTFTDGTLKQMEINHQTKAGYYFKAIQNTLTLLRLADIPEPLNYEHHRPMIINADKFLAILDTVSWRENLYLFRSLYGNIAKVPSLEKADCKIYTSKHLERFEKGDILSTDNPVVFSQHFRAWVNRKYPTKSKYEIN